MCTFTCFFSVLVSLWGQCESAPVCIDQVPSPVGWFHPILGRQLVHLCLLLFPCPYCLAWAYWCCCCRCCCRLSSWWWLFVSVWSQLCHNNFLFGTFAFLGHSHQCFTLCNSRYLSIYLGPLVPCNCWFACYFACFPLDIK